MLEAIKMSKQFGVASFQKAQLENYDYKLVAEFDTEEEAQERYDALSESDNAVQGCTMVVRSDDGTAVEYE